MKFIPDVFAGMIPCISGGTAVHDPNDPCHTSRTVAASVAATFGSAVTRPAAGAASDRHRWVCSLNA
jgi:hypothetical protein